MGTVYVGGAWREGKRANLPALNTGLMYGESVFEAIPFFRGRPLFWRDHVARLAKGCAFLGWKAPSDGLLRRVVREGFRKGVWDGTGIFRAAWVCPLGPRDVPSRPDPGRPLLLASFRPLRHDPTSPRPPLLSVGVSRWRVPSPGQYPSAFKTAFYLTVRREFRQHPAWDEMLRLDAEGRVVDGASSAPLVLTRGEVWAPPDGSGGLEGVTRRRVLSLCASMGWKVRRRAWTIRDASRSGNELVFVGSGLGVAAVRRLPGRVLKAPGKGALRLWDAYRKTILEGEKRI